MPKITKRCISCGQSFEVYPSKASKQTCSRTCRDYRRSFESTYSLLLGWVDRGLMPDEIPDLPDPLDRIRFADGSWYLRVGEESFARITQGAYDHARREWTLDASDPIAEADTPQHKPPQEVLQ